MTWEPEDWTWRDRMADHVRATGWPIFIVSWICDPIYITRWLLGRPR